MPLGPRGPYEVNGAEGMERVGVLMHGLHGHLEPVHDVRKVDIGGRVKSPQEPLFIQVGSVLFSTTAMEGFTATIRDIMDMIGVIRDKFRDIMDIPPLGGIRCCWVRLEDRADHRSLLDPEVS